MKVNYNLIGSSSGCYRCEKYKRNIPHYLHFVDGESYKTVRAGIVRRFCCGILAKNELIILDDSIDGCACSLSRLNIQIVSFSDEKDKEK